MRRLLLYILLIIVITFIGVRIAFGSDFAGGTSLDRWRVSDKEDVEAALQAINPEPILVRAGGKTVSLPASFLQVDRKRTINQIPDASIWQKIAGRGGDHYRVRWQFNRKDLRRLWRQSIEQERRPLAPSWQWSKDRWKISEGRPGLRFSHRKLWQDILQTARLGGGAVQTRARHPWAKRTREDLRRLQPTQLLLDQSEYTLYVYRQGKLIRTYRVAVGASSSPTPNGEWVVRERAKDPAWLPPDWAGEQAGILVPGGSPDNPIVSRWMGIGDGVGIHGTRDIASLGSAASRGCVRMDPEEVQDLYTIVPLGTPFVIRA